MNRADVLARKPWNGTWSVQKPAEYVDGLYRLHQVVAHGFLKSGTPLTEWECMFLQTVARQPGDLNDIQHYWLNRLERELTREAA